VTSDDWRVCHAGSAPTPTGASPGMKKKEA